MDSVDVIRNVGCVPVRCTVYRNYNASVAGCGDYGWEGGERDKVALPGDWAAFPALSLVGGAEQAVDRGCIPNVVAGEGDVIDARGEFSALHFGGGNHLGCGFQLGAGAGHALCDCRLFDDNIERPPAGCVLTRSDDATIGAGNERAIGRLADYKNIAATEA